MTELVSMARDAADSPLAAEAAEPAGPSYPYGLTLNLDEEAIEALGIDGLPTAGRRFHLEAIGCITNSSTADPDADGDVDYMNLALQITHMGLVLEPEEAKQSRAETLYGKTGT